MTGFEVLILFIIVYWLFGPRVLAMVDVLSTRLQAVYNTWDRIQQPDNRLSPSILREVELKRKQREKNIADQILIAEKLKGNWSEFPLTPHREIYNRTCTACKANAHECSNENALDVINVLDIEEEQSSNVFVRFFCYIIHNLRVPSFTFHSINQSVLHDDRVQDAIHETTTEILSETSETEPTSETHRKILQAQTRKAKKIIQEMHSAMSNLMLRLTSYLLFKLLPRFVTSVRVHPSQIEMIKQAAATKLPIIFVPLHRSHLDYILIIFTLLNNGIRPPLTAAGINLKIPIFGHLLRWLGAFYIKRRIEPESGSKDIIYRAALHTYMVDCLKAGHNIKFYIEGGRTRTGKPLLPKVGLLSVIVDAYMDKTVEDALLVPVSVNYDKLVDGNFIRELLGQPKKKETFSAAISAIWTTVNSSYGACRIDFNQPFSLKKLITSFQGKTPTIERPLFSSKPGGTIPATTSMLSLHGTDVVKEDYRMLVEDIANHLVYDCTAACAVMSTNMVAFLLLNQCRKGVKMGVLVKMFDSLHHELSSFKREFGFTGASKEIINSALSLLGPGLVKRDCATTGNDMDEFITPVTMLPNVIELSYYGNALVPQFALQGVIATSTFALLKNKRDTKLENVTLDKDDLMKHSVELCEILQFEFVFHKPCERLDTVLESSFSDMATEGIFPTSAGRQYRVNDVFANDDDDDDDDFEVNRRSYCQISSGKEAIDKLKFYNMVIRPLIDTYISTVMSLRRLVGQQMTESSFAKEVVEEIKDQLDTGYCFYGESCSVDPIKNACKVLKKWGVIETYTKDSVRLVYLAKEYDNVNAVLDLVSRVSIYKWSAENHF